MASRRALVIDPPAALAGVDVLRPPAAEGSFDLHAAATVEAALRSHERDPVDAVVVGARVGGRDAAGAIQRLRAHEADLPVCVFAPAASAAEVERLLAAGATDYVAAGEAGSVALLAHRLLRAVETAGSARAPLDDCSTAVLSQLYATANRERRSLEDTLELALEVGIQELGYAVGYLTRIDGDTMEVLAVAGDHDGLAAETTELLSEHFCQLLFEDTEDAGTVAVPDARADETVRSLPAHTDLGLRCYLGGRLTVEGEPYGTVCFADTEPRPPSVIEAHQPAVDALAQWVGYELERHRYETELQRQIDRLEEFTSVVSHDLRNPLNIAQGRTDLATETCDSEHLTVVGDALDRMEAIIEDSLTLARQGQTVDGKEPIEIADLLDRCWCVVDTGAAELQIVDEFTVHGDPGRLAQVFENLFRNAVEHGEEDVTIRVGLVSVMYTSTRADTSGPFGFYVADDGPGVPPDRRERVFEPGETSRPDGTGFGLAIVKRIVEAHGWSIELTESVDGGARFVFSNVT